jgi:hypothetical protein
MQRHNAVHKMLGRKVYIAKVGVPAWASALGAVVITATAGQAVGPILSGGVTGNIGMSVGGDGGLTLSQSIVLAHEDTSFHLIDGGEDGVIAVSDDGTSFTIAVEAFEDQTVNVQLDVVNESDEDAYAQLTLLGPSSVTIDADEMDAEDAHVDAADEDGDTDVLETITGTQLARLGRDTWLMSVPGWEDEGDTDFQISLTGNAGFHTVRASIKQISG